MKLKRRYRFFRGPIANGHLVYSVKASSLTVAENAARSRGLDPDSLALQIQHLPAEQQKATA